MSEIKQKTLLRHGVVWGLVLVLALLWTWRYIKLNQWYDSLDTAVEYYCYNMGETVPFGDAKLGGEYDVEGYSVQVESCEMVDYDRYMTEHQLQKYEYPGDEGIRILLVHMTLSVEESDAPGVMLTSFICHGEDQVAYLDWDLLTQMNPILKGNYGIHLKNGTSIELVLPFPIRQIYYREAWNHLERYPFYLTMTQGKITKEIALKIDTWESAKKHDVPGSFNFVMVCGR